ncbi:helix-turn-helix domain-containing protein [Paenibacillus popilliae]|uniref:Transposase and inactivated derivative n=1 Tax=Paenibacillus popilliae ATCC 14706 TaxID=1212764 RepID=M9M3U8_PAEPP|nr:helix-turn-helix domain-containing protein [Paenibacillus popilliae]GAC43704.1 transposase and inactivated derivative [Paenibacillus popilliae ATCC 14706]
MTVSERTLSRYLEACRKGGWDALKAKPRNTAGRMKLDPELLRQAIALRRERPARSVEQIIFLLEQSGAATVISLPTKYVSTDTKDGTGNRIVAKYILLCNNNFC